MSFIICNLRVISRILLLFIHTHKLQMKWKAIMCCPLDNVNGRLIIQAVALERKKHNNIYYVRGIYNRTPETLADRAHRFFQRLELIEKIAEIADELFHLFGPSLQRCTTVLVYQKLRNLHHAAHDIEHVLHTCCFLGDLTRLATGKFFEYEDEERTKLDYVRSAARVFHATSHLLATASLLCELKLYQAIYLEKLFKYTSAFSALGYGIWTISLVWRQYQNNSNDYFASDLGIHLAGCVFEAIPLAKTTAILAPYAYIINKIAAVAGIIHASCVVSRLMPKDKEKVEGHFVMSKNVVFAHSPHGHHHHQGNSHHHKQHLSFHPVKT